MSFLENRLSKVKLSLRKWINEYPYLPHFLTNLGKIHYINFHMKSLSIRKFRKIRINQSQNLLKCINKFMFTFSTFLEWLRWNSVYKFPTWCPWIFMSFKKIDLTKVCFPYRHKLNVALFSTLSSDLYIKVGRADKHFWVSWKSVNWKSNFISSCK